MKIKHKEVASFQRKNYKKAKKTDPRKQCQSRSIFLRKENEKVLEKKTESHFIFTKLQVSNSERFGYVIRKHELLHFRNEVRKRSRMSL